jgi:hypothetical protein
MSEDPKKPTDSSATTSSLTGQSQRQLVPAELAQTIHETVVATNGFWDVEKTTEKLVNPSARTQCRQHEASYLASKGLHVYERRHEFGPHLAVGSAIDD